MKSWLAIPPRSHFSLHNIPFGVISSKGNPKNRPAIEIGDHVLDLKEFTSRGGFSKADGVQPDQLSAFSQPTLNAFAEFGRPVHRTIRSYLQEIFQEKTLHPEVLKENAALRKAALLPKSEITSHLPFAIGDYTDFFAGRNHAYNVGTLFRGPANALQPNYNHLPVAYHGRASSVVVSGTPLRRPWGQALPGPVATEPVFRPCARLDIELEMGMFVCRPNELGRPISVKDAEEYIFGYVLMNDWSARDIQQWDPWVVLADALEPFRTKGLENEVRLQSYLREERPDNVFDIKLEAALAASGSEETVITRTSAKNLLWSWPQMVAHHSISGCNLRAGDLFGSGTISGSEVGTQGSLLEQSQGGKTPVKLVDGQERKFLQDGDTVVIRGWAGGRDGELVGFGECVGQIMSPTEL
ncbi:Fumarylacetoacetase [Colletotrichum orbiculare MAFF 240422]|uniref:Fumarylacetoacetase n=1 Tax=Colletotrichum orbiculare (strain 104-T / ATCC 96160 / CBS 514.97 / LARS 414 / MAFF 240422) TaxID=1213857 RepID=A0A484FJP9_COLOR|nr:Fumarylacetoacetase [Colletotrichum orbiculare MAFF 240422]